MIYEIKDILELIPHLNCDACVFIDLDETIIEPIHEFGNHAWEKFLIDQHLAKGHTEEIAIQRSCMFWKALQVISSIQLVQPEIKHLFTILTNKNIFYRIVTARSDDMSEVTERQLRSVLGLPNFPVIHCNGLSKGTVLKSHLQKNNIFPTTMNQQKLL